MRKTIIFLIIVFIIFPAFVFAETYGIHLGWQGIGDLDLEGYRVFMRMDDEPYDYGSPKKEVDRFTTDTWIQNLPDGTYAFVVRAFDTTNNESGNTNEVGPILLSEMYEIIQSKPSTPGGCWIIDMTRSP